MENLTDNVTGTGGGAFIPSSGVNVPGLIGVIAFYLVILGVGLFASWKSKAWKTTHSEDVMLAGRNIGAFVGIFTMTATWVGGGFINGTAEYVFTAGWGVAWTQAPWGYSISLILGGLLFAKRMREAGYVTMLDPFAERYGEAMGALLFFPALLGETFWTAAILSALGASLAVILNIGHTVSVIVSACIAIFYTIIGGLYSVAFTDVVQLICIFIGLWLGVGFAFNHDAVSDIGSTALGADGWVGSLNSDPSVGLWLDSALLLIFGGIPWQVYFQRVLSSKSAGRAQLLSFVAAAGCLIMSVPSILIGAIARSTDWNSTMSPYYREAVIPSEDNKLVLPVVLQYLTPVPVAVIGLGAVSAAVMSSADSSILAAASMFAQNVYKPIRNAVSAKGSKGASDTEIIWMMRGAILVVGALATVLAIVIRSIYGLWFLCSDLVYVILFPQLLAVIYIKQANTYGSAAGYVVALFFRLTGGEPLLSLPPLIKYPYYDQAEGYQQLFPFKTLTMLLSLFTLLAVSYLTRYLFTRHVIPVRFDVFRCFREKMPATSRENVINDEDDRGVTFPEMISDLKHSTKL